MARPVKYNLEYFPLDVDIFDDEKVIPVSSQYGAQGDAVIIRILCSIYRNGYYAECTESFIFKIAKQAVVSHDVVRGVIDGLLKWKFFSQAIYDQYNVISSAGIQRRWKEAVRKRVISTKNLPFWIEENEAKNEFPAEVSEFPAEETPAKQSEMQQKKRKENKEKEINKEKNVFDLSFVQIDYMQTFLDWLEYKRLRRESYKTQQSLEACYGNLIEIARGSPKIAGKIIQKSIANNYAGLFPLKDFEVKEILKATENGSIELQTRNISPSGKTTIPG
jgi:hypothetical protein